jgi:hypothetical protein
MAKQLKNMENSTGEAFVEFKSDPMVAAKKKFPPQPQNHAEVRDSTAELNGFDLQKIQAGPTVFKFGQMFIKRYT